MPNDLHTLIETGGPLPFPAFMDWALYHPDTGYYADPGRSRVGREGDFITSVAVGPLFGHLLARRFHEFWDIHKRPAPFTVIEAGAEDGRLAGDILAAARDLDPAFHEALRYAVVEPMPRKREALAATLAEHPHLTVHASATEISGGFGVVLANEVLDALPAHLLRFTDGAWLERRVTIDSAGALAFTAVPIDHGPLAEFAATLGTKFPDPYDTEVCLAYRSFLAPLAGALDRGLVILIDYGFPADDYYHPARTEGTLRTYARQVATDDPLLDPGQQDITTHVNFTAVEEAARSLGMEPSGLTPQELYLTRLARPLLTSLDPQGDDTPNILGQFRSLTHPAFLGTRFQVAEFTRNL